MKNYGRDQLWFTLDLKWKVKKEKSHVTAFFSAMNMRCFCLLLGHFRTIYL